VGFSSKPEQRRYSRNFVYFRRITNMSILLYHIFLWFYRIGIGLAAWWNPKARRWLQGRAGIFDKIRAAMQDEDPGNPGGPVVWMHCSSLGEFEQGRPVLENISAQYPQSKIVLTFFSPSGYEVRKDYAGADHIFYLPLDSKRNARRFISLVNPSLVLWVKYDYWYYYLTELKKKNIPVLLLSGVFRPDQPFFKWYGRLHRYMLECFTHLFVQTQGSKRLLGGLGLSRNVSVAGDTRFDRVVEIAGFSEPYPFIEAFCGQYPVIVAGSTWPEDEEEIDHYANTHPDIRFIIAPHEIDRDHLQEVKRLFKRSVLYSEWTTQSNPSQTSRTAPRSRPADTGLNTLIIDNIGMLAHLYRYATLCYVGGGFGDDGVHNVLEAAVYGKPVIFGPVIEKYIEAVELVDCGGGIVIDSALEAEAVFARLLSDRNEYGHAGDAAKDYVFTKKGATEKIAGYIQENRLLTS
jgi:3-deoxy-D-manno-octulosonic-acid transferase